MKSTSFQHSCPRTMHNRAASAKWLSKRYLHRFRANPHFKPNGLAAKAKLTYGVDISYRVCYNANVEAKNLLEGTLQQPYAKLRAYILQLMNSDPEGKFVLEVNSVSDKDYVLFRRI